MDPSTCDQFVRAGEAAFARGEFERAEHFLRTAILCMPESHSNVDALTTILENLANTFFVRKRYARALRLYQRCLNLYRKSEGRDTVDALRIHYRIADIYRLQEKLAQSETWYERAVKLEENIGNSGSLFFASQLGKMGTVLWRRGKLKEAESVIQRMAHIRASAANKLIG